MFYIIHYVRIFFQRQNFVIGNSYIYDIFLKD